MASDRIEYSKRSARMTTVTKPNTEAREVFLVSTAMRMRNNWQHGTQPIFSVYLCSQRQQRSFDYLYIQTSLQQRTRTASRVICLLLELMRSKVSSGQWHARSLRAHQSYFGVWESHS